MIDIRNLIDERISSVDCSEEFRVLSSEITAAITELKPNKDDGGRGLSSNHFKFACSELPIYTAYLFSGLLVLGSVIDDFLLSITVPIPKGRNVNLTDFENCRGITLSSVFGCCRTQQSIEQRPQLFEIGTTVNIKLIVSFQSK